MKMIFKVVLAALVLCAVAYAVFFILANAPIPNRIKGEVDMTKIKSDYRIEIGDSVLIVPALYLIDERNRKDNTYENIILLAEAPELKPYPDALQYRRNPDPRAKSVSINLSQQAPSFTRLLDSGFHLENGEEVKYNVSTLQEGLNFLGTRTPIINDVTYIYLQNRDPVFSVSCKPKRPNPMCSSYLNIADKFSAQVSFKMGVFDWYTKQNGYRKIQELIENWVEKDTSF